MTKRQAIINRTNSQDCRTMIAAIDKQICRFASLEMVEAVAAYRKVRDGYARRLSQLESAN